MAFIEWNDELSVGIDLIDRQHMILVRAINLLAMAVQQNSSNELLSDIFATLIDYSDTHFTYEEELFAQFGYPASDEHKAQHKEMLRRISELHESWMAGEKDMGPEVLEFLVSWLREHILKSDKEYSEFLSGALRDAGLGNVVKQE